MKSRESDTNAVVVRLGGDEFTAVFDSIDLVAYAMTVACVCFNKDDK
jgi:GGDEF domain-containing protein